MLIARRALLLGGAFGLVACTGDPRIDVDPAATPNVQASEDPIQDPALAAAAAAIASVRFHLDAADEGPWRDAAIAQCDAQLARFNSPTPFGDPDPVFTASPASADDLDEALDVAVTTLKECAADTDAVGLRLLFISAAAATVGLGDPFSIPGTGTDPTHVDVLESTTELALGHVWALINGLEKALGNVTGDDALRLALSG